MHFVATVPQEFSQFHAWGDRWIDRLHLKQNKRISLATKKQLAGPRELVGHAQRKQRQRKSEREREREASENTSYR